MTENASPRPRTSLEVEAARAARDRHRTEIAAGREPVRFFTLDRGSWGAQDATGVTAFFQIEDLAAVLPNLAAHLEAFKAVDMYLLPQYRHLGRYFFLTAGEFVAIFEVALHTASITA